MEMEEAIKIVRALAAGSDPETGAGFNEESVFHKAMVVKALNRALAALIKIDEWDRNRPPNAGRAWSREEVVQVLKEVQDGVDFHEIARLHDRTVGAIVTRLVKLGKIRAPAARVA